MILRSRDGLMRKRNSKELQDRQLSDETWIDLEHCVPCAAAEQIALGADGARDHHWRRRRDRDGWDWQRRESAGGSADRESRAKCDPDFFRQHNFERDPDRVDRKSVV